MLESFQVHDYDGVGAFLRAIETCNNQAEPHKSSDVLKLPHLQKPSWMNDIEDMLRSASPPMVGKQATRFTPGVGKCY